jgi:hypothetical protein
VPENPIPWWGKIFLFFVVLAWLVRTIVLPFVVSQRTKRPFRYAVIFPEERATFSSLEKQLLILMKIFGYAGFVIFFATAAGLERLFAPGIGARTGQHKFTLAKMSIGNLPMSGNRFAHVLAGRVYGTEGYISSCPCAAHNMNRIPVDAL